MSSALKQRETFEREEKRRLEKIFPLESPKLVSLTEAVKICEGFMDDECGDEVEPDQSQCPHHKRMEDQHYHRQRLVEEGYEEFIPYPHLVDQD